VSGDWVPAFFGALVGSTGSYGVAYVGRGTALETDLGQLALALHDRVQRKTMTAPGAVALLEAGRPRQGRWTLVRARRVNRRVDAWFDRFTEAEVKNVELQPSSEPNYPVNEDEGGAG
jgi:hypothetical protein